MHCGAIFFEVLVFQYISKSRKKFKFNHYLTIFVGGDWGAMAE